MKQSESADTDEPVMGEVSPLPSELMILRQLAHDAGQNCKEVGYCMLGDDGCTRVREVARRLDLVGVGESCPLQIYTRGKRKLSEIGKPAKP